MEAGAYDFLKRMLETPSTSGYEQPVQEIVRNYLSGIADRITTDLHGNVMAVKHQDAPLRVMVTGHSDQIGFLVNYIDSDGYIYVGAVGGWDPQIAIGQRMTVWTASGPLAGVISRKPIHLLTEEERKQVPKIKDLWVDIGAKDRAEVEELVQVGDPITLELRVIEVRNQRICSPALDNKTGLWVAIEAFRRAALKPLKVALYALSAVQEEVGLRGARTGSYTIDPHVAVAIDVTHASDCPGTEKKTEGDVSLGKGPVIHRGPNMSPRVVERLMQTAKSANIPYQVVAESRITGTDASSVQVSRGGVATGLLGLPNRYMHSPVEMCSLNDLDQAADLLAAFVGSLEAGANFIP